MTDLLSQRVASTDSAIESTLRQADRFAQAHSPALAHKSRWTFTGIGTSESVARDAAQWFGKSLSHSSTFVALSSWITGEHRRLMDRSDVLVLISQGLSPNAKIVLTHDELAPDTTKILVTAIEDEASIAIAQKHGWLICKHEPALEDQLLVRVTGPLCALSALRMLQHSVRSQIDDPQTDGKNTDTNTAMDCSRLVSAWRDGRKVGIQRAQSWPEHTPERIVFISAGGYTEELNTLRWIWLEGTRHANISCSDVLSFVHGPYQALFNARVIYVMLERDSESEAALFDRAETVIAHSPGATIVRITAANARGYEAFYHTAAVVEIMLSVISREGLNLRTWPGKLLDEPLYGLETATLKTR